MASLSEDQRTLSVNLLLAPGEDGKACERVADTEMIEMSSRVVIGIKVENNCPVSWPWDDELSNMNARVQRVQFRLQKPLEERVVVDNRGQEQIKINR
ncbi:hypothetical protein ACIBHX_46435 [Nonomuraea sp. NPDC050536]|uniref:hypothetical protein n=1 Tax=Nonomuraea sp. NPDC050536 TaxID=3364366 RepID=UPI0037C6FDCD